MRNFIPIIDNLISDLKSDSHFKLSRLDAVYAYKNQVYNLRVKPCMPGQDEYEAGIFYAHTKIIAPRFESIQETGENIMEALLHLLMKIKV